MCSGAVFCAGQLISVEKITPLADMGQRRYCCPVFRRRLLLCNHHDPCRDRCYGIALLIIDVSVPFSVLIYISRMYTSTILRWKLRHFQNPQSCMRMDIDDNSVYFS